MKIPYWQATRDWHCYVPSGIIVASAPESHFGIARVALGRKIPVLVEKPITLNSADAVELVSMGGIGFAGHTRLYSPAWREFKASLPKIERLEMWAGGTPKDPWWDWGPHLVAMALDLGCEAEICVTNEYQPLRVLVNGIHEFTDPPTDPKPLEVLLTEFIAAIELGEPNNAGLQLGARVIDYLEKRRT